MSSDIEEVLHRAFADIGPLPPEAAVHARARRHRRNGRLVTGSAVLVAVVMLAALYSVRGQGSSGVRTDGLASSPTSLDELAARSGPGATDDAGAGGASTPDGRNAKPGAARVDTTVPSVTVPGQSPTPGNHVFTAPPSGTRLYFLSGADGDLVSTRLDGTNRVVVLTGYYGAPVDAWPDGSRILVATREGGGASVVALDLTTGARRTIVHHDAADIAGVDLAPDGTRLAYSSPNHRLQTIATGYTSPDDVHVVGVDGTGDRTLVHGENPVWFPDGSRLLVQNCGDDGSGRACTIKPDGTGLQMLDRVPFSGPVSWSPDGSLLAGRDSAGRLAVARLDGTGFRTIGKAMGSGRPAWVPGGARVVYERLPEGRNPQTGECGTGCDGAYGLSSSAVDGSGDVRLTTTQNDRAPVIGG